MGGGSVVRRLIGPSLMTAAMLLVLLGLGTWQVRRLAWKEAILAQIAQAEAAPPVPLPPSDAEPPPFTKVAVTGTLMHDKSALFGADVRDTPAGPDLGAFLIEPLQRAGRPAAAGRARLGAGQAHDAGGNAAGRGHHCGLCASGGHPRTVRRA